MEVLLLDNWLGHPKGSKIVVPDFKGLEMIGRGIAEDAAKDVVEIAEIIPEVKEKVKEEVKEKIKVEPVIKKKKMGRPPKNKMMKNVKNKKVK